MVPEAAEMAWSVALQSRLCSAPAVAPAAALCLPAKALSLNSFSRVDVPPAATMPALYIARLQSAHAAFFGTFAEDSGPSSGMPAEVARFAARLHSVIAAAKRVSAEGANLSRTRGGTALAVMIAAWPAAWFV